jgi:hypothetical protein
MAIKQKVRRIRRGQVVIFLGYDGMRYTAHIESVRRGVAKLLYLIDGDPVIAYVDDSERIIG